MTTRVFLISLLILASSRGSAESVCYGTTSSGWLKNGVQLPSNGPNFVSYGTVPELAGRTYVHSKVREVIVVAYRLLEAAQPGKRFKYAETGFEEGGQFKPHKTHQNGLSVDFMVPVVDAAGNSVHLPTHPFNKYGYAIEFDADGRFEDYTIDYEALSAHIVALHKAANQTGIGIWRIIFDPRLAPHLYETEHGEYIRDNIIIPKKPSWVRHDEHYHVDFEAECRTIKHE